MYKKNLPYKIDGIIFTIDGYNYNKTINLKWKPPTKLTIDFLALSTGKPNKYILNSGILDNIADKFNINPNDNYNKIVNNFYQSIGSLKKDENKYRPILFYNSIIPNIFYFNSKKDLNGHVIELSFDNKTYEWKFRKIRSDRDVELKYGTYYGNNYKVAEQTLQSILNPLTIKELTSSTILIKENLYFKKQDSSYKNVRSFNNYVKNMLIYKYKDVNTIIDLASGRGGDLNKYINTNVKNLLMLEIDINAIEEIINRKYTILPRSNSRCDLSVIKIDLNQNYKKNISLIDNKFTNLDEFLVNPQTYKKNSAQVIHCHFAMHYFLTDASSTKNILSFITHYLSKDGIFIVTIFNGDRVFKLLEENNGSWKVDNKYMIKYNGKMPNKLSGFGHFIDVLLPLSDIPYKETLISIQNIKPLFESFGLYIRESQSFANLLKYHKSFNHLDDNDITFIGLYDYIIFRKKSV